MFGKSFSTLSFKKAFYGIALGGLMLLGISGTASASNGPYPGPYYGHRAVRERLELHRATRHGFYSGQANFDRRQLARLRYERGYRNHWR